MLTTELQPQGYYGKINGYKIMIGHCWSLLLDVDIITYYCSMLIYSLHVVECVCYLLHYKIGLVINAPNSTNLGVDD